jgi:hypothetical protein
MMAGNIKAALPIERVNRDDGICRLFVELGRRKPTSD